MRIYLLILSLVFQAIKKLETILNKINRVLETATEIAGNSNSSNISIDSIASEVEVVR